MPPTATDQPGPPNDNQGVRSSVIDFEIGYEDSQQKLLAANQLNRKQAEKISLMEGQLRACNGNSTSASGDQELTTSATAKKAAKSSPAARKLAGFISYNFFPCKSTLVLN